MPEEELLTNKKIALRFLKETGLLIYWKKYLNSKEYLTQFYEGGRWYEQKYIVSIFGTTRFSDYLRDIYNINGLEEGVFLYFKTYIKVFHPEVFNSERMNEYNESHKYCGEVSIGRLFERFPQFEREYEERKKSTHI